jgi:REP element-mobilizing transposase RayT
VQRRHNQHLAGFSYVGFHRYFLTFCTINRARVFTTAPPVDLVLAQIVRAAGECSFAVPTYRFMPDHLHFLVEAKSHTSDGLDFIDRTKQYSGFYYKKAYAAKLWQRYTYDHVLRDDEKTVVVARHPR